MTLKEIYIRPFRDCDLCGLNKLLNDMDNQRLVGGALEPMTPAEVLNWLSCKESDKKTHIFAIIHRDEFAGYVLITSIDKVNGHAVFGINISKSSQGQGVGAVAMDCVHIFCKDRLSLRKLVLNVREDNHHAIALYERLGYKCVGSLSHHTKVNGLYVASNIMEVFL